MSWAESREAGLGAGLEVGQGHGKLMSYDWLTKSSPGLPVFKGKSHIFARANAKGKRKKLVENVFTTYLED